MGGKLMMTLIPKCQIFQQITTRGGSVNHSSLRLLVVVMMARGIAGSSHLVYSLSWHGRGVLSGVLRSGNAVSVALSSQSINNRDALAFEPTHLAEETTNGDFAEKTLQPNAY